MIRSLLNGLNTGSRSHRQSQRARRGRRLWVPEGLEDRVMLSASPTIYTVNATTDTGTGTGSTGDLLYCIEQANANPNPAGSMIEFSTPLFSTPQTITLTSTLELSGSAGAIEIEGPGANLLTVSGNNAVGVFTVDAGANAFLNGLTISSGLANSGAGINNNGELYLFNSTVTNNVANSGGEGGGIANSRMLSISGCTITNNSISGSAGNGGGVFSDDSLLIIASTVANNSVSGNGRGGGVYNSYTATVEDSTIAGNSVGSGGNGGGLYNDGQMTVFSCTIASNSTGSGGNGGGIYNVDILSLPDSTVVGNSAGSEGGGVFNDVTLTAVNTTIAYNFVAIGGTGGGLESAVSTTTLDNTIVALNTHLVASSSAPDDIGGTVSTSSAFNLIGTGGAGGLTNGVGGNQVGVANPGLGMLANNGGSLQTIALLPGSPAIDTGSNALDGLAYDERGTGFARIFNGTIDIGAYELQPAAVAGVTVDWGTAGSASLQTAADGLRLLPAGRNNDLPWLGIDQLQVTFNEPTTLVAADVTLVSAKHVNYGPVTISGSGTTFTITLAKPINVADRVTITIGSAGSTGIATFIRRLDVLPGDFNDDGVVNRADQNGVRSELGDAVGPATIFADIVGDPTIDNNDVKAVKKHNGTRLPRLPRNSAQVMMARALARQHHGPKVMKI